MSKEYISPLWLPFDELRIYFFLIILNITLCHWKIGARLWIMPLSDFHLSHGSCSHLLLTLCSSFFFLFICLKSYKHSILCIRKHKNLVTTSRSKALLFFFCIIFFLSFPYRLYAVVHLSPITNWGYQKIKEKWISPIKDQICWICIY